MSYLGNTPTTQSFISGTDYFNGDGSTTAFTLSRTVVSVNDIEAVVNNVVQQPNTAYNISGTTITFTSAPSSGTSNVYVRYLSTTTQSITPSQNTVSYSTMNTDMQGTFGGSFKNRIINGAMMIDQRNAGASYSAVDSTYCLDRWKLASYDGSAQTGKFTVQQNAGSVTPPAGFINYLGITSSAATTGSSTAIYYFAQLIEGLNVTDLGWGTASASSVTVSFWVRSSLTGTFGGAITNSAQNYSYPFTFVINSANTWEQKTITIVGPTAGTWLTTNGVGARLIFNLGTGSTYTGTSGSWSANTYLNATGSTNFLGTNGATFYITGVQLEKGSTATSFDYRPYGTELALCQRYYQKLAGFTCAGDSTTSVGMSIPFTLPMRSSPSVGQTGVITIEDMGSADRTQSSTSISIRSSRINTVGGCFSMANFTGLTAFRPFIQCVNFNGTDNYITLSAEL